MVPSYGVVIIGVLSGHVEFDDVRTMPYSEEYGKELRTDFERQLNRLTRRREVL